MASYAWKGRDRRGDLVSGQTDAADENAVAEQLLAGGVTPVAIEARQAPARGGDRAVEDWLRQLFPERLSGEDCLVLTRQLYTLNKAGVPLLRALAGLEASTDRRALIELLADLRASLDQGRELSAAMGRHPLVFSPFYLAMVRVGELSGRLSEVLLRLAAHIEFELDVRQRIKQALRYPMLVIGAIVCAMVIINLFVLPTFAEMFAGFNAQLPLMTRLLLGVSAFTVAWWPLLLGAAIGGVLALRSWLATPEGAYRWDRRKLRLPIVGPIVRKATLGRFARSFAIAAKSGVPVSQALTVVAQTVDNRWVGGRIEQMRDGVERGESLSRCAAATGVFTPMVLQMIAVGEETGELDTLLLEIAEMFERDTDHAIKHLSSNIEPLLLLVIGAMVLVLALGVFMPLWSLGQAAMGRGG